MPVKVTLDAVLEARQMTAKELAQKIGMSETQLSLFRCGKVRGIRFSSLARICSVLACTPGDLLDYEAAGEDMRAGDEGE